MDKSHVLEQSIRLGLKAVRCRCREEFQSLDLQIYFKIEYQLINLNALQRLADEKKLGDSVLNPAELKKLGLISTLKKPVKVLGNGELKTKVQLEVNSFSKSAQEKIEAAGGKITKL
jgi:ribosomal protein L15